MSTRTTPPPTTTAAKVLVSDKLFGQLSQLLPQLTSSRLLVIGIVQAVVQNALALGLTIPPAVSDALLANSALLALVFVGGSALLHHSHVQANATVQAAEHYAQAAALKLEGPRGEPGEPGLKPPEVEQILTRVGELEQAALPAAVVGQLTKVAAAFSSGPPTEAPTREQVAVADPPPPAKDAPGA